MATLRNKRKLASVSRHTKESTSKVHSQNTIVPGITEDYITQRSEEIDGRVIRILSREFSWTESRVLRSLSKLDEFLLNLQFWTCSRNLSGDIPEK